MQRFAAAFLFTLALSAAAYGQTANNPKDAAQDEAAIRAAIKSIEDAWNAHDGRAFAAPFAADADYVVVNGMYVKGKEAIEKGHADLFSTLYKESRNVATIRSVRFLRPDVAVAHLEWNLEFKAGGETRKGHAINTMVFTKENGKWVISAFQNTPVQAQAGPPPGQSRP